MPTLGLELSSLLLLPPPPATRLLQERAGLESMGTPLARDHTGFMLVLGCRDGCLEPRDSTLKF